MAVLVRYKSLYISVADPDLELRVGGGGGLLALAAFLPEMTTSCVVRGTVNDDG